MSQTTQKSFIVFVFFLFVVMTSTAKAQKRWSIELRPSINFPTNTPNRNKNTGFGIEGKTLYMITQQFSAYMGWAWNLFPAPKKVDFSYEESGFTLGGQYVQRVGNSKINYFIGGGGVYSRIETENKDLDLNTNSGYAPGWQIETGLIFTIEQKLQIKPGIRYRNISAENLNYLSLGVGIKW